MIVSIVSKKIGHKSLIYTMAMAKRNSSIPTELYSKVWRKSNVLYITYVVLGCVVLEGVYGSVTSMIWDTVNKGVCNILLIMLL